MGVTPKVSGGSIVITPVSGVALLKSATMTGAQASITCNLSGLAHQKCWYNVNTKPYVKAGAPGDSVLQFTNKTGGPVIFTPQGTLQTVTF
jgi:hypothetical protein